MTAKLYDPKMSLDGGFLCDVCSKTFTKSWGLRLHKKIHLGLADKQCSYCRKKFSDQANLDEHKAKDHSNGEYSEQFKSEALEMAAEVGIEKAAEKLLLHESTLRSWMTTGSENYCSECHKSFRFQSLLKNHMKLHEGKEAKPMKTFKEKRFSEAFKKQVIEHAKLYSGKSAGLVFGLGESTVRSILKAESFPCDLCERKCAYKRQLERHLLEVHKVEQVIKPEESPKKVAKVTSFPCNLCERKCAYKAQLKRHLLAVHKVEQLEETEKKPKIENGENVLEQSNEPNILAQNDFSLQDDLIQYDSKEAVAKTVHENSFSGDTTLPFEMFEQIYETEDQKEKLQDNSPEKEILKNETDFSSQADLNQSEWDGIIISPPETMGENKSMEIYGTDTKEHPNGKEKSAEKQVLKDEAEFVLQADLNESETMHEDKCMKIYGNEAQENQNEINQQKSEKEVLTAQAEERKTQPKMRRRRNKKRTKEAMQETFVKHEMYGKETQENQNEINQQNSPEMNALKDKPETQPKKKGRMVMKGKNEVIQETVVKKELLDQDWWHNINSEGVENFASETKFTSETKFESETVETTKEEEIENKKKKAKNVKRYEKRGVTCTFCGVITKEMRRHMVKHTKLETFKCDQCESSFGLSFNLKRHIETTHNPNFNFFHCSQCVHKFTNKANLVKHELRHKGVLTKTRTKFKNERFSCDQCKKVVAGKSAFKSHVKQHTEGKPSCDVCKKEFSERSHLKRHQKRDHPETVVEKIFQCNICNDLSSTNQKLKRHYSVVHNQILKEFLCATCSKSYVDRRCLEIHIEVAHLKLRKFSCQICGKEFGRKGSLTAHTSSLHSGDPVKYSCDQCPVVYKSKRNLQNHAAKEHFL